MMRRLAILILAVLLLVPMPASAAPSFVIGRWVTITDGPYFDGSHEGTDRVRVRVLRVRVTAERILVKVQYEGLEGEPVSAPYDWTVRANGRDVRHAPVPRSLHRLTIRVLDPGERTAGWMAWKRASGATLRFVRNLQHRQLTLT